MRFRLWLVEALQTNEIKTIIDQVSKTVSPVKSAQLLRDALGHPQAINLTPNAEESPGKGLYKQAETLFNLQRFVGRNNPLADAEILSLGLQNGGFVTMFLGHLKNGMKVANVGRSGDLLGTGIIAPVTNILKGLGYKLFTHPKDLQPVSEDADFVDELSTIFRAVASLQYHQGMWPTLVPKIQALQQKYPLEWSKYHARLRTVYGEKPIFYRSLGLPEDFALIKVGSKEKLPAGNARVGDRIYFPTKWPLVITQMSELPEHLEDTAGNVEAHYTGSKGTEAGSVWAGTGGPFGQPVQVVLRCEVPINQLLLASTPMLAGSSTTVKENEVVVKVNADISPDKPRGEDYGITCTIAIHSRHGSKSKLGHTLPDEAEREKLYSQGKAPPTA